MQDQEKSYIFVCADLVYQEQVYKRAKKAENIFRYGLVVWKYAFENSTSWEIINYFVVCHEVFLAVSTKTENCCLVY